MNKIQDTLDDNQLRYTNVEKDLGLIVDNNLNFEYKAYKVMGLIRRSSEFLDSEMLTKAMVHPHIEYASTSWFPITKKMKNMIENVQRRATKRVNGMREKSYEERLKSLKIPCLLYRKIRGDMIEVYKMCNNKYDEDLPLPLNFASNPMNTRGSHKLTKSKFNKNVSKYFIKNSVVNMWNKLPDNVKNASSTNTFKNRIDELWGKLDIIHNFD